MMLVNLKEEQKLWQFFKILLLLLPKISQVFGGLFMKTIYVIFRLQIQHLISQLNCLMLFRLAKRTCWHRQSSLIKRLYTSFDFGSQKNQQNNKTELTPKGNPITKEDGKNQTGSVENHKVNNLNKINQQKRQKQPEQEPQKQQEKRQKKPPQYSLLLFVAASIGFGAIFCYNSDYSGEIQQDQKQKEDNIYDSNRLIIITGQPGNGKTIFLKQQTKKLRKQGNIVYYHSLRGTDLDIEGKNSSNQLISKQIQQLFSLLNLFFDQEQKPTEQGKLVYLVIDDIHLLQAHQKNPKFKKDIEKFWEKLASVSEKPTRRAFVICNTSTYAQALKQKSYVEKRSTFTDFSQTQDQLKPCIKFIFDFYLRGRQVDSNSYEQTIEYLSKQRYSLKQIQKIVKQKLTQLKDVSDKSFLESFKTQQKQSIFNEYETTGKQVIDMYNKLGNSQKKYHQRLLQEILNLDRYDGQNGCLKAKAALGKMKDQVCYLKDQQTLDNVLEKHNLLFYCYPRTERSRRVLELIFASMQ